MSAPKNVLRGVPLPTLENMIKSRVAFIRGMKQLHACGNALALNGGALFQNEFWSQIEDIVQVSTKGADASVIKMEGSIHALPIDERKRAVSESLQHICDDIGNVDGKLDVILTDEVKEGADDEVEEDLPCSKETDDDRPTGGSATKVAEADAYDARMELKIQSEELDKLKALNQFTTDQLKIISVAVKKLGSEVGEARANVDATEPVDMFGVRGETAESDSFVPTRPTLTEMMKLPAYRATYDTMMVALKVVLGTKFDKCTSDNNLDKGVEPVNMTPHKILRRVWDALSDANKGELDSQAELNFCQRAGKSSSTYTKELTENIKAMNELQEKAREASADGIGPSEKLKKTSFLQDLRKRDSDLWLSGHVKMESFQEMCQEMILDAKTKDEASSKKPRAYMTKEPYKHDKKKKNPPKSGKVPAHVTCRFCEGPHHVADCPTKPEGEVDFQGKCRTCNEWGHRAADCKKKKAPNEKSATKANVAATTEEPKETKEVQPQQQMQQPQSFHPPCGYHYGGMPMHAGGMPAAMMAQQRAAPQQSAATAQPGLQCPVQHPMQPFGPMQHQGMGMPGYGFPGGFPSNMAMGAIEQQRHHPEVVAPPVNEPAVQPEPLHGQEQRRHHDARAKEWLIRG